jgi:uncharacterized protein YwgA
LIEVLHRVEQQPYHHPVGRTIFQKIAYVATEQGLPTGLAYRRGSFGPFAAGLKMVESQLMNSGLLAEERRGNLFLTKVGPNYERVREKYEAKLNAWDELFEKTVDLFLRADKDRAELIATVLFAAAEFSGRQADRPSEKDVLDSVMRWKQKRKPPFEEPSVASTIRHLGLLGWWDLTPSMDLPIAEEEDILS